MKILLRHFDTANRLTASHAFDPEAPEPPGGALRAQLTQTSAEGAGSTRIELTVEARTLAAGGVSYGIEWTFEDWSEEVYTFMPAGLYAGNRFDSVKVPYSPRYPADRVGPVMPLILTDVPRLERARNLTSHVGMLAGDLAWPAFAYWNPRRREALLVHGESHTGWGETLWELEEPAHRRTLYFRVTAPGVRARRYEHMRTDAPSSDRPNAVRPGETDTLVLNVERWPCADMDDFFRVIFGRWHDTLKSAAAAPPTCPFSFAFGTIAGKYNLSNWHEGWKLYLTVPDEDNRYPYQTGWCGGGISAFALLASGDPKTRARALDNIDTICREAAAPSGLLFGKRARDGWIPDFHGQDQHPHTVRWTLARRQGDALFYLAKAIHRESFARNELMPEEHPWRTTLRRLADSLCRVWREERQWGHFLDNLDGSVAGGGTCSGAVIPAGLVLAHKIEGTAAWLDCAEEGADAFLREWTRRGLTAGGPGDALGNLDSESAAGLVESYVWLWESTGAAKWMDAAAAAARQLATWVMPYAYPFPAESEFGRLGMVSTGTVFANTQNKHSAPGICTHSGESLLRLFRATGDSRFLDLLRAVARALPQYMSRTDRPVHDPNGTPLPPGWINERVNTSDWDNNRGGVFHGSCWCEVSALLTWMELPGVYACPDSGRLVALDHVEVRWSGSGRERIRLRNPTAFPARVRLLVEGDAARRRPLPVAHAAAMPVVDIAPGEETEIQTARVACTQ